MVVLHYIILLAEGHRNATFYIICCGSGQDLQSLVVPCYPQHTWNHLPVHLLYNRTSVKTKEEGGGLMPWNCMGCIPSSHRWVQCPQTASSSFPQIAFYSALCACHSGQWQPASFLLLHWPGASGSLLAAWKWTQHSTIYFEFSITAGTRGLSY